MEIGKLKKVEIRKLWKGEASDFTPWLAKEENIELLSEEIGIELEVISEEKSVGSFRADILCKSIIDNNYVLVENQLEKTDHNHLGQLMTYAAGLEAVTIIWIAKKFTEEHRAALDWLNKITDEEIRFFGIEVEAYQIGDSVPAPMFQIVSKPNDWTKAIHHSSKRQRLLTETQIINLEYWTAMKEYFETQGTKIKSQKPSPDHWTNYAIGRSEFSMDAVHNKRNKLIRVEFLIEGDKSKERFDKLREKYELDSYAKIDKNLIWDKLGERKSSKVYLEKDAERNEKTDWPKQFQWFLTNLEKMDTFFRAKIKAL